MVPACTILVLAAAPNRLCEAAYDSTSCPVAVSQVPAPMVSISSQDMSASAGRPSRRAAIVPAVKARASQVADQATTRKQRPCWRSPWSSTMAASKRKVATIEVTAITPSQTLKVPISAGVHRRVRSGATSIGNACAPVAPARTVMTFL